MAGGALRTGAHWVSWLLPGLLLVTLLAPGVHAADYEGPGQEGIVPLGIGGSAAELTPMVGEGLTHVALKGVADGVCRIVLDSNESYAGSLLVWSPGNETAYVAAEPGQQGAPFRIASHWKRDLNDECTAEVTPEGTVWHKPRGRPFIEMGLEERFVSYEIESGGWTWVEARVFNNGTLSESINVTLEHMRSDWEIRNATGVVDIPVDPLETVRIGFEVFIPEIEPSGTKLLLLHMAGKKSGWADKATLVLDVRSGDAAMTRNSKADEDTLDPHGSREAPSGSEPRSGQIPAAGPLLVVVALVGLVALLRPRLGDRGQ